MFFGKKPQKKKTGLLDTLFGTPKPKKRGFWDKNKAEAFEEVCENDEIARSDDDAFLRGEK